MDCDTTGVEPAIGLVAYKTLAGGGLMTLPIRSIPLALENLNYEPATIEKVLNHIQEYGTIESIQSKDKTIHSGIRDEDIAIFDSAFASGRGQRSLPYMDHIKMMAAVQPFLSGAISKTVNMPKEATVEEIRKPISKHGVWVSKASLFIVMAQNVRLRLKLELTVKKQNLKYKLRPSLTVGNFPIRERP
jgi:ribonucleoside-diphosphate reductase alpha chain